MGFQIFENIKFYFKDSNEIKEDLSTEKDNKTDKSGQKGGAAAAAAKQKGSCNFKG